MFLKTILLYPFFILKSIGIKSFENIGRSNAKSGKQISRSLPELHESLKYLEDAAQSVFQKKKSLTLIIDDTLISKKYSREICGTDFFYDTKTNQMVMGIKGLFCAVTDGNLCMPLSFDFLYVNHKNPFVLSKNEMVKHMINHALNLFSDKLITVAADGAFANRIILDWCLSNNIRIEMRMKSNCKVFYKNQFHVIRNIPKLKPKGKQKARTIKVLWHEMQLYLTAEKRIDKHGEITFVYLIATFKAKSIEHITEYKNRWFIEKMFRTTKQSLGLKDCFSTKLETQKNHIGAVLVAYAITQIEQKKYRLSSAEEAIKSIRDRNYNLANLSICRSNATFGGAMA